MSIANGFASPMLREDALTTLGLLNDKNIEGMIKKYPEIFRKYYITAKEGQGAIKRTKNRFFEQWVDENKPFEKFKVTEDVAGGGAGQSVTVTLTGESHYPTDSGLSPVAVGHFFVDDATGIEYEVVSVDKSTPGAHTAVLNPTSSAATADISAADSVFLWRGRLSVEEASKQADGHYRGVEKRRRYLSAIRTDKKYSDDTMLETLDYGDNTYYNLDKTDINDRHLHSTETQLMFGEIRDNIQSTGSRNTLAEGLIPQVQRWGTDLGTGVTIDNAFYQNIARTTRSDGYSRHFDVLAHSDFIMANEDYLDTVMVQKNIQVSVTRDGLNPLKVAFDFGTYDRYGIKYDLKEYDLFNTGLTYGSEANEDSYLAGAALFIPQGDFVHPEAGNLPFFQVRYQAITEEGWTTKMMSDGGMLPQSKNTNAEIEFSLLSWKGIETYNIQAYKWVTVTV